MMSLTNAQPNPTVLVADDEPYVLRFLQKVLQKNYSVATAADGYEAMRLLSENEYDLMLTDVDMPGPNGIQLLNYCHRHHPSTQVLLLTGKPQINDAVATVKKGAFDYLTKPVSPMELRQKLDQARKHQLNSACSHLENTIAVTYESPKKYRVLKSIGSGTMGTVLQVEKNGVLYAMKILRCQQDNPLFRKRLERFRREGEAIARLDHPGIVKVVELGLADSEAVPYIVMEYVEGKPLSYFIKNNLLTLPEKLDILAQVADALAAVHKHKILHRDVKPANVMIQSGDSNRVKLTDFGVARLDDSSLTGVTDLLGSPAYMAPECFSSHAIDERADIFSLGVLAYELLTGHKPFAGETLAAVSDAISNQPHAPIREAVPDVPPNVEKVIDQMLAKKPADRYCNASEIVGLLQSA